MSVGDDSVLSNQVARSPPCRFIAATERSTAK
jgi:hypothetical protein